MGTRLFFVFFLSALFAPLCVADASAPELGAEGLSGPFPHICQQVDTAHRCGEAGAVYSAECQDANGDPLGRDVLRVAASGGLLKGGGQRVIKIGDLQLANCNEAVDEPCCDRTDGDNVLCTVTLGEGAHRVVAWDLGGSDLNPVRHDAACNGLVLQVDAD